jgi:hypothetical protein
MMSVENPLREAGPQQKPQGSNRRVERKTAATAKRRETLADGGRPIVPPTEAEMWFDWDPEYLSLQNDPS